MEYSSKSPPHFRHDSSGMCITLKNQAAREGSRRDAFLQITGKQISSSTSRREVQIPHIERGICALKSTSPIAFLQLEQTITLVS